MPWEFEFPFPGSLTSTFLNLKSLAKNCARAGLDQDTPSLEGEARFRANSTRVRQARPDSSIGFLVTVLKMCCGVRKVDIRLLGKENSNTHGARPVYYNHLDD